VYEPDLMLPSIEWCKIVDGMQTNDFFGNLFNEVKTIAKDLLRVCSEVGDIKVENITLSDSKITAGFPTAHYRVTYKFYDDIDDNIYNLTQYTSVQH
jgi:hypothetical protein